MKEASEFTKKQIQARIDATLKWCNRIRAKDGKKPLKKLPKGERYNGSSCPCGSASGYFVGRSNYKKNAWSDEILGTLPAMVTDFTRLFDHGFLPQFDKEAKV